MKRFLVKANHAVNRYSKAIVVALCALLFAVCFMAVGLSTANGQALTSANPNPEINGGGGNLRMQPHA